jgi:RTX calcium-binding nonapeptide repeat (4 copies)
MSKHKTRALGAVAGACLAATLATTPAFANTTAKVQNGTLQIQGDKAGDFVGIFSDANQVVVDLGEDGSADFTFDRASFTALKVDAGAGDDEVRFVGLPLSDKTVTADGGSGDDTLIGGASNETLIGGTGNDFVDGNIGADTARLGSGNDTFQWDPGDGSDTVEGEAGNDKVDFNGSNANEDIDVSANGSRVRLFRNVAAITMDLNGIDALNVRTLGGTDNVTVNDLTGTGLDAPSVDLAAFDGGTDSLLDRVIVNATPGADKVKVDSVDGKVRVSANGRKVEVAGADPAQDRVAVNTLAGADTITSGVGLVGAQAVEVDGGPDADTASYTGTNADDTIGIARDGVASVATFATGGAAFEVANVEELGVHGLDGADTVSGQNGVAGLTNVTIDGDDGDDRLTGTDDGELIRGGDGDDFVDGNRGEDDLRGGNGDDTIQWDPGDGSDIVDGRAGQDAFDFNGSNANEHIQVTGDEGHVRLTRDIAAIFMDIDAVERVRVRALGGTDAIDVDSLAHTDVDDADVDLGSFGGGGDASADIVTVGGTSRPEKVDVTRAGGQVDVTGLAAATHVTNSDGPADQLVVQTFAGDDDVTVAPDVSELITPVIQLGVGE